MSLRSIDESVCCLLIVLAIAASVVGQEGPATTSESNELLEVARSLSSTTLAGGEGPDAYAEYLHPEFSRWSAGREVVDHPASIKMIREWWDAGNRQASSEEDTISVQIVGNTGVIRKRMTEKYVDGEGKDTGSFSGFVTQTWVREAGRWKLLSATIQRQDAP